MNLEDYIAGFHENTRDAVVSQILKAKLVKQAFDTPAGKALLNSAMDEISIKVMAILSSCTEKTEAEETEKIKRLATEVHVAYNLLRNWADILVAGEKHEEAMK